MCFYIILEGHWFVSILYAILVLPSLNKDFTYLLTIFRLGILDYLLRLSVYFGNFPVRQTQMVLHLQYNRNFWIFFFVN